MVRDAVSSDWFAWVRDIAFVAAIVGGVWVVASAIGDVRAEVVRNAALIERNAQAIERSAQAIERNAHAIGEVKESLARLSGQYAEHVRLHPELAVR